MLSTIELWPALAVALRWPGARRALSLRSVPGPAVRRAAGFRRVALERQRTGHHKHRGVRSIAAAEQGLSSGQSAGLGSEGDEMKRVLIEAGEDGQTRQAVLFLAQRHSRIAFPFAAPSHEKTIAAGLRHQKLRVGRVALDLLTQPIDVRLQCMCGDVRIIAPNLS